MSSFSQCITLSLEDRDAEELLLVLCGYHNLLADRELEVVRQKGEFAEDQCELKTLLYEVCM